MTDTDIDGTGSRGEVKQLVLRCRAFEQALADIRQLVDEQADDESLWFVAQTAPEAYLQTHLRQLHALVEDYTVSSTTNELPATTDIGSSCDATANPNDLQSDAESDTKEIP